MRTTAARRQADRHAASSTPSRPRSRISKDLPLRHRERIWHFFEHCKALEEGKWAKVTGWGNKADAQRILLEAIERAKKGKAAA